jgi:hypothetical protein
MESLTVDSASAIWDLIAYPIRLEASMLKAKFLALTLTFLAGMALLSMTGQAAGPTTVATFNFPDLPGGMALDAQGNIIVASTVTGEVFKLTPQGQRSTITVFNTAFGTGNFSFLNSVALNSRGEIYVIADTNTGSGARSTRHLEGERQRH